MPVFIALEDGEGRLRSTGLNAKFKDKTMRVRNTSGYRDAMKRLIEKRKKRRERKEELASEYVKDYIIAQIEAENEVRELSEE